MAARFLADTAHRDSGVTTPASDGAKGAKDGVIDPYFQRRSKVGASGGTA